ncbi:MAG: GGDEF domain-containing protein [Methylococcaceae bacterium]|nr:GGDEF domain-containing protein [Methylococcaceae bacterium]
MNLLDQIRLTMNPGSEYITRKMEDYRDYCITMIVLTGMTSSAFWIWDYVIDPTGAGNTIGLRLLMLFAMLPAAAVVALKLDRIWTCIVLISSILVIECLFIAVITHLNAGVIYGYGAFLYWLIVPVGVLQGFSFRTNLIYVTLAGALPQLAGYLGIIPGFNPQYYAVLIWPGVIMTIILQFAMDNNYRTRYHYEKKLALMARTDPLTGINNRRSFMAMTEHEIHRAIRYNHPLSLVMLDIDRFKSVNDTYGHPTGDQVITACAQVFKRKVRDQDIVGRLGGEEFAITLPETNMQSACIVAERIRRAIAKRANISTDGREFGFTLSVGVSSMIAGDDIETLLLRVDKALYAAKQAGRNQVWTMEEHSAPIDDYAQFCLDDD